MTFDSFAIVFYSLIAVLYFAWVFLVIVFVIALPFVVYKMVKWIHGKK